MPLSIINIVLAVTFIYLLNNRRNLIEYKINALLFIVLLNFVVELVVYFINQTDFKKGSSWTYNFTLPIELFLYGILFKRIFQQQSMKIFISIASYVILIFFVLHYFQKNSFFIFNESLYTYMCVFILACVLYFFIRLFIKDYFLINPLKQFYFWLSSGLLICYLGGFMLLTNAYTLFYLDKLLYNDLKILNLFLNIFLYLFIIIGIECLKKFKTHQIQSL
jgi:hypothetical protein